VGDIFTCSSDGFPQPTYQWTNVENGEVTLGQNLTVYSLGDFHYICTARNSAHGTPCDATSDVIAVGIGMF